MNNVAPDYRIWETVEVNMRRALELARHAETLADLQLTTREADSLESVGRLCILLGNEIEEIERNSEDA